MSVYILLSFLGLIRYSIFGIRYFDILVDFRLFARRSDETDIEYVISEYTRTARYGNSSYGKTGIRAMEIWKK